MDNKVKAMTVRLPIEQARELEAVAEVDEMTVSDAVRVAIDEHIQARRKDAAFKARLQETIRANHDILERLAR